jgi:hypothetical protein
VVALLVRPWHPIKTQIKGMVIADKSMLPENRDLVITELLGSVVREPRKNPK